MASTSACLAGLSNASLAVAMSQGFKATLLYAHGPTVLTNPEPSSADFLSACAARSLQPGASKTRIHALM